MAVFGTETRNSGLIARDAIESAMAMQYFISKNANVKLIQEGLPNLSFRIGIDMGQILVSRIGITNNNFLTAVGNPANRASKLQELAVEDGICIGENLFQNLRLTLQNFCSKGSDQKWDWKYKNPKRDYSFFHYEFNWPEPREWMRVRKHYL